MYIGNLNTTFNLHNNLNTTFDLHNNFNTTFNLHNNLNAIFNLHNNINTNQRRNDTLVYCAKIYMLLNRKSASIYRYLMRVTLSNFQCFTKPITAFMDD